jgi:LAO/AO transport system kinase
VLRTVAAKQEGIPDVIAALDRHFHYLEQSGVLKARRRARLRERVVDVVQSVVNRRLWQDTETNAWLDARLSALEAGSTNPFAVADELLARSAGLMTRSEAT